MAILNGTKTAPTRDEIKARRRAVRDKLATRDELKARRRAVRDKLDLIKLEQMESILWDGFGGSDIWFALRERMGGGASGVDWVPPSQTTDRGRGRKWPLWQTELELNEMRQKSRIVCDTNSSAQCLMTNTLNHVVGKGFTYKCQPKKSLDQDPATAGTQVGAGADAVVTATQTFVDRFLAINRWTATITPSLLTQPGVCSRERETVRRTFRDGESNIRFFFSDGMTYVRFVEPEQITQNGGANLLAKDGWSFGWQHAMEPFEDTERKVACHIAYQSPDGGDWTGEIVPAAEMVQVKLIDEDAAIKRGTPAFSHDMLDALIRAGKLQRNLSISSAIQAATAEVWKHNQGTVSQISSIAQGLSERQYTDPVSGKTKFVDRIDPGSVRRIPAGMEPVQLNFGTGSKTEFQEVVQGDKREASSALNAPEHFTGDASNANYSSTKEAGNPFVISAEVWQSHFGAVFAYVVWKAIAYAVECGQLPPEALKVVELQVEPTAVPPTDPLQAAQESQIYGQMKVKSRRTTQMELGLDPDHEDANIEEDEQRFGMGGGNPLAAMMGGDDGGGGVNNPRMPAMPIAKMTESLMESFTGIDANGHKWVNGKQVPIDATTTDDHADSLKALHAASITAAHDPQAVKDHVAKMAASLSTPQLKEVAKKFGINNTGSSKAAIADAIQRKIADRREMFQRAQGAAGVDPSLWTTKNRLSSLPQKGPDEHQLTHRGATKAFNVANKSNISEEDAHTLFSIAGGIEMPIERRNGSTLTRINQEHFGPNSQLLHRGYVERVPNADVQSFRITKLGLEAIANGREEEKRLLDRVKKAHPAELLK